MITNVIITNRHVAADIVQNLKDSGKTVCWITISNKTNSKIPNGPLVRRSSKHILVCQFDDVSINPITKRQARRIKNFVMNHHLNMAGDFILVVNCHAGISRSAAVGMFCLHNLHIPVQFGKETFPNAGVMQSLGVNPKHWASIMADAIWDDERAVWRTE